MYICIYLTCACACTCLCVSACVWLGNHDAEHDKRLSLVSHSDSSNSVYQHISCSTTSEMDIWMVWYPIALPLAMKCHWYEDVDVFYKARVESAFTCLSYLKPFLRISS